MQVMTVESRSHYDVLGVAPTADDDAIRRAWKLLVQVWHPDRFHGETRNEAERMTARINEAFHTLRDPRARERYDAKLAPPTPSPSVRSGTSTSGMRSGRAAPTRVGFGTPAYAGNTATPTVHPTMIDMATVYSNDLLDTARRHPKIVLSVIGAWAIALLVSVLWGGWFGPGLPQEPPRTMPTIAQMSVSDQLAQTMDTPDPLPADASGTPVPQYYAPQPDPSAPVGRAPRHILVRPNNH